MNDFQTKTTPKARKPHRCEESRCRRTRDILPGQVYVRIAGSYEGDFYTSILCTRCDRAYRRCRDRFGPYPPEEGPALGELLDFLIERRWDRLEPAQRRAARQRAEARRAPPGWLVEDAAACGPVRRWVTAAVHRGRPDTSPDLAAAGRFHEHQAKAVAGAWPLLRAVPLADVEPQAVRVVLHAVTS